MEDVPVSRWRQSVLAQVALLLFGATFLGIGVSAALAPGPLAGRVAVAAAFWLLAVAAARITMARIDLYWDRVVLRGLARQRAIPLAKVLDVTAGRYGLRFRTARYVWVSGPIGIGEKGLALSLLNIETRGDRIADAIMSQATAFKARHPDPSSEIERVVDDLSEILTWTGYSEQAAWFAARRVELRDPDMAARRAARRDLYDVSTGRTGLLEEIYLGSNAEYVADLLKQLATLTD